MDVFGVEHPVALVTGGGAPRIGNAIARTLAERGYRVALHAHRSAAAAATCCAEWNAAGYEAWPVTADLTQPAEVEALVQATLRRFGRIDVLVNSAAIWEPRPLEETTADDVQRHFDINVLGMFLCCQAVGLKMAEQSHGGAIVNLGDWAVVRPYIGYAAYFPSKGAVVALTRSMAVELAMRNPSIRVNAVLPGPVTLPADMPAEARRRAIAGTLLRREGSPQHVADAVLALLENDFITGVCLPVDGGRSIASPEN